MVYHTGPPFKRTSMGFLAGCIPPRNPRLTFHVHIPNPMKPVIARLTVFAFMYCSLSSSTYPQLIAGGVEHSLAVCSDGTVEAWGEGGDGQLGQGANAGSLVPVTVNGLSGVTAVAAAFYHSLALRSDGTVWAWGGNVHGQLGTGNNTPGNVPMQVTGLTGITAIAAGWYHNIALKNDGTVWTWGFNNVGQLGDGTNTSSNVPLQVPGLTDVVAVAGGSYYHSLVLKNDGTVWGWGYNYHGQLGDGTNNDTNVPVQANTPFGILALVMGGDASFALLSDGSVYSWGNNELGQLGDGTTNNSNTPALVAGLNGIVALAAGIESIVALDQTGALHAWGRNFFGEFGDGTTNSSSVPVNLPALPGVTTIAAGEYHVLRMKNDGSLHGSGWNGSGQLGTGDNWDSVSPVQVTGLCVVGGTDELTALRALEVHPNPATSVVFIEAPDLPGSLLILSDATGREVHRSTATGRVYQMDLDAVPAGSYVLCVRGQQGTRARVLLRL